jgi:hypothetical protein
MPKKIKFESFKNHFLVNANELIFLSKKEKEIWNKFLLEINFQYDGQYVVICRGSREILKIKLDMNEIKLYVRGDKSDEQTKLTNQNKYSDEIKKNNKIYFKKIVSEFIEKVKLL